MIVRKYSWATAAALLQLAVTTGWSQTFVSPATILSASSIVDRGDGAVDYTTLTLTGITADGRLIGQVSGYSTTNRIVYLFDPTVSASSANPTTVYASGSTYLFSGTYYSDSYAANAANGYIAGTATVTNNAGTNAVPEPASLSVLAIGAFMALRAKRKNRSIV